MARKNRVYAKSDYSPVLRHFINLAVNRVVVDNLPEEIDEKFLVYHALLDGRVLFFKKGNKYHTMWFSGKGKLNEYYIQNQFLVVNPWADETSGDYDENNAGILYSDINAYLDNTDTGLYDFCKDYADIINSIDSSIRALAKNSKVIAFITGASNSIVNSAKQMVNSLLNSDNCIGVCEESLVDSIRVNPIADRMDYKFSELIKARQYYISDFYQKLGIANNQNMKAERLTDNESQLIENVSDVDFNHILDNLNYSVQFINKKFGLNISFRLNEDEEVDDNSREETNSIDGEGTEPNGEGHETSDIKSGVSGEQDVSGGAESSDTSEEDRGTSSDNVNTSLTDAIRQVVAEMLAEKLRGENDERRVLQSEVQGLSVSSEEAGDGSEDSGEKTEVDNNSEETSTTEAEGVEVNVEINLNNSDSNDSDTDEDDEAVDDNSEDKKE